MRKLNKKKLFRTQHKTLKTIKLFSNKVHFEFKKKKEKEIINQQRPKRITNDAHDFSQEYVFTENNNLK